MTDRQGDACAAPRLAAAQVEQCLDALFAHLPAGSAMRTKPTARLVRIAASITELQAAAPGMPLSEVARIAAYVLDDAGRDVELHTRAGS